MIGANEAASPARSSLHQAAWTAVDQVFSSIANFGITIAVARAVNEHVAGSFAYAFLLFSLALGIMHCVATDPFVIRFSAAGARERSAAARRAAGSSLLVALVAAMLCLTAALAVRGDIGAALLLLAAVLPGHFLQDSWRSAAFASGDARKAAANDGLRMVVEVAAIGLCIWSGTTELVWYMASWALGTWAGAMLGVWQFGTPRGWRASLAWLRESAPLGVRLGSEFTISMGGFALTTTLLLVILGTADTGGMRFAQTLLGPIQVLFGAIVSFVVPFLARRLAALGPRALGRPTLLITACSVAICVTVVGVLLLLPDSVGRELLGDSWKTAQQVLLPVGVTQCAQAVMLCAGLPLKALSRADVLLRATLVQAPLSMALALGGALSHEIVGAVWGLALGHSVGCVVLVFLVRRVLRGATGASAGAAASTAA
ncbi:hypothetical protein [Blastococcus sp. TF02A-26]|uniref:hypothetical protein n=1 Tax=Blastococcus sp. TF02A-26 TaxID=2250577 RepID=UPI000DEB8AE7|nr:hypothetical protein [Blastococcus sp. TF02A-26]RBY87373.1 hypothetical protein DQ240_07220 [Blastococcus sp. TF02A-26]